uniref:Uncharacterized protein n=1 Tax=Helianthus annuus TaxID=4232 RepID=A0A251SCY9_HELAN
MHFISGIIFVNPLKATFFSTTPSNNVDYLAHLPFQTTLVCIDVDDGRGEIDWCSDARI